MTHPADAAADLVAAHFPDDGIGILVEAELERDWRVVFRKVPPVCLEPPDDAADSLEWILRTTRDFFSSRKMWRAAIALTRAVLKLRVARVGNEHPDSLVELGALGALADRTGRTEEARRMLTEAWEGLRSHAGGRDLRLAVVSANLGNFELRQGRREAGIARLDQAWRIRKEVAPKTSGLLAAQLAELRADDKDLEGAVELLQDAWAALKERHGLAHPRVLRVGALLAEGLIRAQRPLKAEPVLRAVYQGQLELGDPEAINEAKFQLAEGLFAVNLQEEAYRTLEQVIVWTRSAGDPHPLLPERLSTWARVLIVNRRRPGEGEQALYEALEVESRLYGDNSPQVAARYAAIGHLIAQAGREDEALGYLDSSSSLLRSTRGDHHPQTVLAVGYLVQLLTKRAHDAIGRHDFDLARAYAARAREVAPPVLGWGDPLTLKARDIPV